MRKIKFRAWIKPESRMSLVSGILFELNQIEEFNPYQTEYDPGHIWDILDIELMQYTGLKDKNGKEIYEGDVVKCFDMVGKIVFGGFWKISGFGMETKKPLFPNNAPVTWDLLNPQLASDIEVIGNIYETPKEDMS